MTSFLVGIAILILAVLALSRSLFGARDPDSVEDNSYDSLRADEFPSHAALPDRPGSRREANAMVDDFVLQDAVDEQHDLTDLWDDDEIAGR